MKRIAFYLCLLALFALHQDSWFWGDATLLFGFLPIGLAYHGLYCLVTSLLWFLMVTYNWPDEAEAFAEGEGNEGADSQ